MSVIRKASVFAAVLLGFCVGTAHAQDAIAVDVPFPFVAGHMEFAAGRYLIHAIDYVSSVIEIEGITHPSSTAFLQTNALYGTDPAGDQPSLVFTRGENGYRLAQIWDSTSEGRELSGVRIPPRDGRAGAQGNARPEEAYVIAANWR